MVVMLRILEKMLDGVLKAEATMNLCVTLHSILTG